MAIVIFIAFSLFVLLRSFRLFAEFRQLRPVFSEYSLSLAPLKSVIILLTFSLLVYVLFYFLMGGLIGSILALLLCMPAIFVSRRQQAAFDFAGTDRVSPAKAALARVFSTALIGILYFSLSIIYCLFVLGLQQ